VQVSNFCIRTSQWKSCEVEEAFGRLRGNRDQYCELFLRETLGRELNFKKSPAGPGGPRRFNGQNRTRSWGISLDLSDVGGISRD